MQRILVVQRTCKQHNATQLKFNHNSLKARTKCTYNFKRDATSVHHGLRISNEKHVMQQVLSSRKLQGKTTFFITTVPSLSASFCFSRKKIKENNNKEFFD